MLGGCNLCASCARGVSKVWERFVKFEVKYLWSQLQNIPHERVVLVTHHLSGKTKLAFTSCMRLQ